MTGLLQLRPDEHNFRRFRRWNLMHYGVRIHESTAAEAQVKQWSGRAKVLQNFGTSGFATAPAMIDNGNAHIHIYIR